MPRLDITQDEEYPVYHLAPPDPEIADRYPGVEVDQALVDEYNRVSKAWSEVQRKLSVLSCDEHAEWMRMREEGGQQLAPRRTQ